MFFNSNYLGVLYIALAQIFFTTQDMVIKFISSDYALHEIVLIRSTVGILFTLFVFIPLDGGLKNLFRKNIALHLLRGFGIVIANLCFFTSLITIPLGEAVAIFFIAPVIITSLSVIIIGEKVSLTSWIAVFVGFFGVLIILRPGFGVFNFASLLPLIAALAYAFVQIMTRKMGQAEKASKMVFYIQLNLLCFSVLSGLIFGNGNFADPSQPTLYFLLRPWVFPTYVDLTIMFGIGIFSGLGAYCMTQSYRISKAGFIAPFEYLALPLSIFWSIYVFDDWPDFISWIGILLITCSGLYVALKENTKGSKKDIYIPIPRNR